MKNIKVMFLSAWYPNRITPLNGDFVERQAMAVAEQFPTTALHVAADADMKGDQFEIVHLQRGNLHETLVYFRRRRVNAFNKLLFIAGYLKGYHSILKSAGNPDIIHANIIYRESIMAYLFRLFTGIPYILSEHWTQYLHEKIPYAYRSRFLRIAVNNAAAVVTVTQNLSDALRKHGFRNNRFHVIPNVVDTGIFKPGKSRTEGKKRILHVSSMKEEHKNISGIIRTIARLSAIRKDFNFTFAGDASGEQMKLAGELGLSSDEMIFTGEVDHITVARLMKESDMLVMFSNIENLPCVILEAISCGVPVISTFVGGIHEWLTPGQGILVEPRDEDSLLKAIISIMDNKDQYKPDQLHQYAEDHFSNRVISEKLGAIYNSIVLK
jgi:glycosyltransferase involved in cell wall biosynthesis